jgi:hypothetical protein
MDDAESQRLLEELNAGIRIVNRCARRYRTWNMLLLLVSLVGGLLTTALAGESAMGGKQLPQATVTMMTGGQLSDLAPNWRMVCGVISLVNLLATGATAAVNLFKISERSTEATLCVGALEALRVELATNSHLDQATVDEVRADYVKLLKQYAAYFR